MDHSNHKSNTIAEQVQQHQHQINPPFLLDSLYCSEDHWEDEEARETETCSAQEPEEQSLSGYGFKSRPPVLLEQDLSWDDDELSSLFAKEERNHVFGIDRNDPFMEAARRRAVEWVLKVVAHYSFSAPTAVLAVNYLDRFLSSISFQSEKPWMTQLAAVACLSLAAKMEETQVPLLLDLQVEESKLVFEAKTIQRMEILVLSTLEWKMNPVTPLSFLDYITRRLGLKDRLCCEFLRRCELTVLSVITDTRFMRYLPSVMASATMLHVVNCLEPCLEAEYHTQLLGMLRIDHKDMVDDCLKVMLEVTGSYGGLKKRKIGSIPSSPSGVMEVSFSSDSSNDSWAVSSSKKSRTQEKEQGLL